MPSTWPLRQPSHAHSSWQHCARRGGAWVRLILTDRQFPVYPDGHTTNSAPAGLRLNSSHTETRTQNTHSQHCLPDLVPNHESLHWCQPSWQVWPGTATAIHGNTIQLPACCQLWPKHMWALTTSETWQHPLQYRGNSLLLKNMKHDRVKQHLCFVLKGEKVWIEELSRTFFGFPLNI